MTRALLTVTFLVALSSTAGAQRTSDAQAARLMTKGDQAAAAGRLEEAVRHYQRAAELAPGRSGPSAALAAVLLRQGKCDEAMVHARRYRELKPGAANPQVDEVFQRCAPPTPPPQTTPPIASEPATTVSATATPRRRGRFRLAAGWVTNVTDLEHAHAGTIGAAVRLGSRLDLALSIAVVPFMIIPEVQLDLMRGRRIAWFASIGMPYLFPDEPRDGAALLMRTGLRFDLGRSGFAIEVSAGASKSFDADWSVPLWTQLSYRP